MEMFEPSATEHLEPRRAYANPVTDLRGLDVRFGARARDPAADRLVNHHTSGPDQLCHGYQFPA
eukprot:12504226-Alexandrium_andersonii.AAC.1